jgi:hypothetical protein
MTDKDQRITRLQHDLRDGRIKLREEHSFSREYLGEWKDDRVDEMAYAATATALHKCALCDIAVAGGDVSGPMVAALLAEHRQICPARPIEVGDYVRWEYPSRDVWAEGTVTEILSQNRDRPTVINILVSDHSGGFHDCDPAPHVGEGHTFGNHDRDTTLRRIPRPGAGEQHAAAMVGTRPGATTTGTAQAIQREIEEQRFARGSQHDPVRAGEVFREVFEPSQEAPPAPALVDGLTRAECLERFTLFSAHDDDRPPWGPDLTPSQLAAAREEWSAALRAKVDAAREQERNRVRVEVQDVD